MSLASKAHVVVSTGPAKSLIGDSGHRVRPALAWTVAAALVVMLILGAGEWAARRELAVQFASVRRAIEVDALGLRGVAARYRFLPFTAAQHPAILAALRDAGNATATQRANLYLEAVNRAAGSEALYLMDLRGLTLAASNWNESSGFVGQSYTNRPYFAEAADGRDGTFYGIGLTTGAPGLFMSAPVEADGKVVGVIAVKVSLQQIQDAWVSIRDPIVLTDARGIVFLSSVADWRYHATKPLSADDLTWIARHKQYGDRERFLQIPWTTAPAADGLGSLVRTTVDGKSRRFVAVNLPLPDLDWQLTAMGDYASVAQARVQAWIVCTLCTVVLLLGGFYWRLRERRFKEQRDARRELEHRVLERTQDLGDAHAFRKAMEDSLLVGMRARNLDGRIIYVNPALCSMSGYEADDLLGCVPPYPYWHPDDTDEQWRNYRMTVKGESAPGGIESRMRHRDGHDVLTMTYTARLIDAAGNHTGWMSSVVDITSQKRAERQQRQNEAQLQHAQRLASLGEMASTLAHELNQPLAAMSNYASAAKAFALQGNQALLVETLDETARQAQRSAEIVKRIRGFVRQRTVGVQECHVESMLDEVLALLRGEFRARNARVEVRVAPDLPSVSGDRLLLEQVLVNLVLNGLQAMDQTSPRQRVLEIDAGFKNNLVTVRVADRGAGIEPSIAEQVFTAFFTSRAEGLGLGLSICRSIAERHGGALSFASRAGGGTVFTLTLRCNW